MFNVDTLLYKLLAAMTEAVGDKWSLVKNSAEFYLAKSKERLILLAKSRLDGEIDNAFVAERLKDEWKILESELLSFEVIGKSIAQEAINNAVDTFQKFVDALLPKKD